jgi:hypothetical protein
VAHHRATRSGRSARPRFLVKHPHARGRFRAATQPELQFAGAHCGAQTPVDSRESRGIVTRASDPENPRVCRGYPHGASPFVLLAMQKVVGSNPISRSRKTCDLQVTSETAPHLRAVVSNCLSAWLRAAIGLRP